MTELLFIGALGPTELVVVFMLAILLFGAQKLPKLARASGQAMGEFQKGRQQVEDELREMTRVETDAESDATDEVESAERTESATEGTEPSTTA